MFTHHEQQTSGQDPELVPPVHLAPPSEPGAFWESEWTLRSTNTSLLLVQKSKPRPWNQQPQNLSSTSTWTFLDLVFWFRRASFSHVTLTCWFSFTLWAHSLCGHTFWSFGPWRGTSSSFYTSGMNCSDLKDLDVWFCIVILRDDFTDSTHHQFHVFLACKENSSRRHSDTSFDFTAPTSSNVFHLDLDSGENPSVQKSANELRFKEGDQRKELRARLSTVAFVLKTRCVWCVCVLQ